MFTGLVEGTAEIVALDGQDPLRITLRMETGDDRPKLGDSIAIDGVCLTVVECGDNFEVSFEAATETLQRTTLGTLRVGEPVNYERALRLGDRLDGHLVTGHVDCVGEVALLRETDSAVYVGVRPSEEVYRLTTPRGSVTLAGVSLTVTDVSEGLIHVSLIPHTREVTTLGGLSEGSRVNVEADMMARYVARILSPGPGAS